MRQVRAQGKRAAPRRAAGKTAKRVSKAPSRKRAAPNVRGKARGKARGRKLSAARVWERRIEGWRRFFIRHAYLRSYAALAALTLGAYGLWTSGVVERTGSFVSAKTHQVVMDAGFTVTRITVAGHVETSPGEVMAALDVEHGAAIFDLDLSELQARVEALDWVSHATIVRALPGTIHVTIVERQPFALWQNNGVLYVISEDGSPITSAAVERFSHLRHVVGVGAGSQAASLFAVLETVPGISPRIRYAVRVSDRRWDLYFDSGVVVQLPERDMVAALEALASYEKEYRLLARAIETVDLRLDDRIVIRPRSDTPDQSPAFSLPAAERET